MLVDVLVTGLAAGFVSVGLMVLFELPFWKMRGMQGVVEWQVNQIFVSRLLREEYDHSRRLPAALAMHFFHGVLAGGGLAVILSIFLAPFMGYFWLIGSVYSLILWAVVPLIFRRTLESAGRIQFTSAGLVVSLASHLVYGLTLGALLQTFLL